MPTLRERAGSLVKNMTIAIKARRRSTLTADRGSPEALRSPEGLLERLGIKKHKQLPLDAATEPFPTSVHPPLPSPNDSLPPRKPPQNGWLCSECRNTNLNENAPEKCSSCGHTKCVGCKDG
jgi:hypothetical protein